MKQVFFRFACCALVALLLLSCEDVDSRLDRLLNQARKMAENDPENALVLLEAIRAPERLDTDGRMRYTVILTEARFQADRDITQDSLIFEAQKYFSKSNNAEYAALAHHYAGRAWRARKVQDESLASFSESSYFADKLNDSVLAGKNYHILGNIYLELNLMDSASVRYKQALAYYGRREDTNKYVLLLLNSMGISLGELNKLDSACFYQKKGLALAKQMNDTSFQATFKHMLGFSYCKLGEYNKSEELMLDALNLSKNRNENSRINLALAILYDKQNKLDSAKVYMDTLQSRLPELDYIHTLKRTYKVLRDYNRKIGNNDVALIYSDSLRSVNQSIAQSDVESKLVHAEFKSKMAMREREKAERRMRHYYYIAACLILLGFILLFIHHRFRQEKLRSRLLQSQAEAAEQQKIVLVKENELLEKDKEILAHEAVLLEKDKELLEQHAVLLKKDKELLQQEAVLHEKDKELLRQQAESLEQEKVLLEQEKVLLEKDNELLEKDKRLLGKDKEHLEEKVHQLTFLSKIYQSIGNKWTTIEWKVKELGREYGAMEEPPIYLEIRNMMDEIRVVSNEYLLETAKEYLNGIPSGAKVLQSFSDDELLLLMLQRYKYKRAAVTHILGKTSIRKYIHKANFYLVTKLGNCGMSHEEVQDLMFPDDPRTEND